MASPDAADDVQLTDLEVIQQFSLAVRGATASRAQVIAALESDLAYLRSSGKAASKPASKPASQAPSAPARTPSKAPAPKAVRAAKAPAGKAVKKSPAKKAVRRA